MLQRHDLPSVAQERTQVGGACTHDGCIRFSRRLQEEVNATTFPNPVQEVNKLLFNDTQPPNTTVFGTASMMRPVCLSHRLPHVHGQTTSNCIFLRQNSSIACGTLQALVFQSTTVHTANKT
jgi:hypothetical protein